jgi:hypothetical protein
VLDHLFGSAAVLVKHLTLKMGIDPAEQNGEG